MKELSIIISVTPKNKMKKSSYTFIADPFDFNYTIEKTSAGNCFNCDKDITIELPDSDIVREFSVTRQVIVHLRDSSNRIINLGTTDIPAPFSFYSIKTRFTVLHSLLFILYLR